MILRLIPETFTDTFIIKRKTRKVQRRNGSGLAESELEQAEEFKGQFTDVFNKSEHTQVPLPNRSAPFLKEIHVSAEGVTKLLKGFNPSKAFKPDELHPRVLKEPASEQDNVCSLFSTVY